MTTEQNARKQSTLGMVHTVPLLVDIFAKLAGDLLPGVRLIHIVDQPVLLQVQARGPVAPEAVERLSEHIKVLADVGADAVLCTCSSLSLCIQRLQPTAAAPTLRIDEAMFVRAVATGQRIGLVATAPSALAATRQMLMAEAARVGKEIVLEEALAEGGLAFLQAGDGARHDQLVQQAIERVGAHSDVVVLAQASMDRVLAVLPSGAVKAKVLSSPRLALAEASRLLSAC